ncbi:hypothetical protein BK767_18405 [Bacillus thuringiensis serovar kyushuensis]|uniref:hypothetical protein n=1 Tax=Bacillus thuringiensis TaxID=1428 RepID=UPI000B43467E|nr:hypothetical protein [Bacillus thuringiensis]MEC2865516.1 hypothetical protein [Bacillus cereus]OTZ68023.1 hypothetical protein BK768_23735 [Bacillus thuringiensis serovar tohokuensis]OTZ69065.1 hypothetical protein BK767_18405 [Bacillus thuringiensis serovar kyushuensis]OUB81251.1 hypothetical protein BK773_27595 [Bacillus thuringiensis serovar indiana]
MTLSVLKKDVKKKQILDEFLQHCEKKQIEAIQKNNPLLLCIWIKEARLARRELIALYREKEKYDNQLEQDRKSISGIVAHLRSRGINASTVGRAHHSTLSEECY